MNATVAKLVDILFQDNEMTPEVQTIKDEVMSNCQDRFADCMARGLSEDEAIMAVMESLKGMEEVLAAYPRRQVPVPEAEAAPEVEEENPSSVLHFAANEVTAIEANLMFESVQLLPGNSSQWTVDLLGGTAEAVLEEGVLRLKHRKTEPENPFVPNMKVDFSMEKNINNLPEGIATLMHSVGGVLKDIGRFVITNVENVCGTATGSGSILIHMPAGAKCGVKIQTTSGDIAIGMVPVMSLCCETMSGHIHATYIPLTEARCKLRSTSGEVILSINAGPNAGSTEIQTMSGQVEVTGNCAQLTVSTVSGDVEVTGDIPDISLNSVSGDGEINLAASAPASVSVRTTSGDLHLHLPDATLPVHATLSSISGNLSNRHPDEGEGSPVVVTAQTVSGDVKIR